MAKEIGYQEIQLITNGRRLAYPKYALDIINSGINGITVSVHGPNQRIHDSLTRSSGSFLQTMKGIQNLLSIKKNNKNNFSLTANTVIVKNNCEHINEMIDILGPTDIDDIHFLLVEINENNSKVFDIISPRYSYAGEKFCDAIEYAKSIEIDPERIGFLAPFCSVKHGYQNHIRGVEVRHTPNDMNKNHVIKPSEGKRKTDFCKDCTFDMVCGGISKGYIDRIGFDEFKPILKENNLRD